MRWLRYRRPSTCAHTPMRFGGVYVCSTCTCVLNDRVEEEMANMGRAL